MAALLAPTRRSFLTGLSALVAAPAIIRTPGLLMPVRTVTAASSVEAVAGFDPRFALIWVRREGDQLIVLARAANAAAMKLLGRAGFA